MGSVLYLETVGEIFGPGAERDRDSVWGERGVFIGHRTENIFNKGTQKKIK